jgi:hypothetical protein
MSSSLSEAYRRRIGTVGRLRPGLLNGRIVERTRSRTVGLTFSVGGPGEVFDEPFSGAVRAALRERYGDALALDDDDHYWSEELGWSGWSSLQTLARQHFSADRAAHLLSMEAWCGVYVPAQTEPFSFELEGQEAPLDVASLTHLMSELEALGKLVGLPVDDEGLRDLAAKYLDSDELLDADMEIQTYAQLLLAAHEASRRSAPLWVVK